MLRTSTSKILLSLSFLSLSLVVQAQEPMYKKYALLDSGYRVYYSGDYEMAGNIFFSALKDANEKNNLEYLAETYRLLGEVNRASNNKPYALKYLNEAERLFNQISNDYGLAYTKNRKAAVYLQWTDTLEMKTYLRSSIKICRDNGFKEILYNNLILEASYLYNNRKDFAAAFPVLYEAVALGKESNLEQDFPYLYNNFALAYRYTKQYDSALYYAQLSLEYARKYDVMSYMSAACGQLSLIYGEGFQDYQKAWEYERLFRIYYDTLYKESREREISEIVENYRIELKEEQISGKNKVIRLTITMMAALGVLFIVTIIILVRMYRQRKKLRESELMLKDTNMLKDRLLSVLSHDLRAPVATLQSTLDLVMMDGVDKDQLDIIFRDLSVRIEQTGQLLDNLLVWIKSQVLQLEVRKEQINLGSEISRVQRLYEPAIRQKSLIFIVEVNDEDRIFADLEMFRLVLRNLLSNAIKFSSKAGKISISLSQFSDEVALKIQDEGRGISTKMMKKIFENNEIRTAGTNEEIGTGIGLSVVKHFVELNNGRIEVESKEDKGSTFTVYFPKS
ncbi:MAG: HAMP domain-containing histidine kinase [Bacteroidetes bacterium]|nr:MAG: HAMP domain-containing histidine kinase [Bacteroidota bacterium]